ncbi:MAG: hypothetical protein ABIP14_00765 [Blastocatellia bacterium]
MLRKSADHTGAKIQFGGFHDGFSSVVYQPSKDGVVRSEPIPATAKQIVTKPIKPSHCRIELVIYYLLRGRANQLQFHSGFKDAFALPTDSLAKVLSIGAKPVEKFSTLKVSIILLLLTATANRRFRTGNTVIGDLNTVKVFSWKITGR